MAFFVVVVAPSRVFCNRHISQRMLCTDTRHGYMVFFSYLWYDVHRDMCVVVGWGACFLLRGELQRLHRSAADMASYIFVFMDPVATFFPFVFCVRCVRHVVELGSLRSILSIVKNHATRKKSRGVNVFVKRWKVESRSA